MRVLTPAQMRDADAKAFELVGDVVLMQAAGQRIAEVALRYARGNRIVAFAGRGNNGGDALAALAVMPADYERIVYAEEIAESSPARRDAQSRARNAGVQIRPFPGTHEDAASAVNGAALLLDGLLGTGAHLPVRPEYAPAIAGMNQAGAPVLAIDVPTGIDAESGAITEPAVDADVTVTLGALKIGLLLTPARSRVGELWLGEIGIPPAILDSQPAAFAALDDAEFLSLLPHRAEDSDKRKAGAPLIVAGSTQFPGAAVLSAMGAARSGAGYVTIATPDGATAALREHLIEQVVVAIPDRSSSQDAIRELLDVAKRCFAVGIGPGLGLENRTGEIVRGFVQLCELPMVADASALFHFAKHLEILRGKAIVLTPHAGEFARLSGKGTLKEGERVARLRDFVDRSGVTTLLKGEATLVYDGKLMHVNTTGTPALATAGTGDVLTGMIATLLSQGLGPVDAARAAAYWHGLAAKHAASLRPAGVIARDVAEALPFALPATAPATGLRRIF